MPWWGSLEVKLLFRGWTGSICSASNTWSELGSACWLRHLLHLKFFSQRCDRSRRKRKRRRKRKDNWKGRLLLQTVFFKFPEKFAATKWALGTNLLEVDPIMLQRLGNVWKSCSFIRVDYVIWFFWQRLGLWTWQLPLKKAFGLPFFIFLLFAPGSALEKFAAIASLEFQSTRVNWSLSWSSALEIYGSCVLSGFNRRSDFFGKGRQHKKSSKKC